MGNTDLVRTRRFAAISVMNSQEFDACDVNGDSCVRYCLHGMWQLCDSQTVPPRLTQCHPQI